MVSVYSRKRQNSCQFIPQNVKDSEITIINIIIIIIILLLFAMYYYCYYYYYIIIFIIIISCFGIFYCCTCDFVGGFLMSVVSSFLVALGNRDSPREVILIAYESPWLSRHTIIYYIYCIINGCAL